MKKDETQRKLKILFLFVFSQICAYLFYGTSSNETQALQDDRIKPRKNYTEISIDADLKTSFEFNKPVTLISKQRKVIIPHAFLVSKVPQEDNSLSSLAKTTRKYVLSLPLKFVNKLLNQREIIILPYAQYKFSNQKRFSYEISF